MCVLAGGVFNFTGMMAEVSGADLVAVLVCLAKLGRPAAYAATSLGLDSAACLWNISIMKTVFTSLIILAIS